MKEVSTDPRRLVRFGAYELDLRAGELRKSGVRLRLQQQPLQLLSVLLERPGEIVTREELRRRLWPDDTFVDFEHGLNAAVKRLRDTLGDSADSCRFIETLPKRGYRFVAPTDLPAAPISLDARGAGATDAHPVPIVRAKPGWLLVALAVVIAAAGLWVYRAKPGQVLPAGAPQAVPFTTFPGQEIAPTFSPDGSQIAFAWSPEGPRDQFDLYVKVIGSEKALRLTTHPADFVIPAWSPDGRQLAFARLASGESGIYLVSALGGPERKLADAPLSYYVQAMLSWSPDGKSVAFSDRGPSDQEGVSQIDITTLKKRWWGNPSPDCMWSWVPAFSPDGRSLAVGCKVTTQLNDLFVWPTAGGVARPVARVEGDFTGMTWTADGESLIYAANGDLWRVAESGGPPEALLAGRGAAMPAVSNGGERLAYAGRGPSNINLWQVPLAAPSRLAGPPEKRLSSTRFHGYAAFSPDGRRVAFTSDRSGSMEVWTSDGDGSNPVALTTFGGLPTGSPEWSPDGRFIAFDSREKGLSGVYVVPSEGGPHRRVATGVDDSSQPAWSIDGKWLYFGGRIKGAFQIFKVPVEGGAAIQLTSEGGGFAPQASADGARIYYTSERGIHSVSTAGGDERRLVGMPPLDPQFIDAWGLSPTGIYFINPAPPRAGIDFFEFASARILRVVDLPGRPAAWGGPLAISRDGRRLLYPQLDGVSSDIMIVENFR
ncbi:MAG TPA: winged helix-turn-helix domain-containing protein [Vicinamibacterales bacterium]|jgi:Tol biopolymer transport system component/DNA-binding winged helix-turn-helix (wHTH) protein|nr:winged helix-turn-helix domain-containing protein [Vicinamibacterales bacterium]